MKKQKLNLKILLENDQMFEGEFNINQKVEVIINQAKARLKFDENGRVLRREDGTEIPDTTLSIETIGLYPNETLKYFKRSDKPDRDQRFA